MLMTQFYSKSTTYLVTKERSNIVIRATIIAIRVFVDYVLQFYKHVDLGTIDVSAINIFQYY